MQQQVQVWVQSKESKQRKTEPSKASHASKANQAEKAVNARISKPKAERCVGNVG